MIEGVNSAQMPKGAGGPKELDLDA